MPCVPKGTKQDMCQLKIRKSLVISANSASIEPYVKAGRTPALHHQSAVASIQCMFHPSKSHDP